MPLLTRKLPTYRHQKASGQAIVTLNGPDHYLGPWKSKASRLEYDRLIGEWLAGGKQPLSGPNGRGDLTIAEVIHAFRVYAADAGQYARQQSGRGSAGRAGRSLRRGLVSAGVRLCLSAAAGAVGVGG